MKNQKKKALLATSVIAIISMIFVPNMSKAVLQANPTTHANPVTAYGANWLTSIRKMETTGQTMGLNETLESDGYTTSGEDNGIDVHMMLPTEYAAVAILSTSGYGNPGKLQDEANVQKRTTTGNSTGVYFTGNFWICMAASTSYSVNKYNRIDNGWGHELDLARLWHGGSRESKLIGTVIHWYTQSRVASPMEPTYVRVSGNGLFSIQNLRSITSNNGWINGWTGARPESVVWADGEIKGSGGRGSACSV